MNAVTIPPTDRTRIRRHPERGCYDTATIHDVLDAGFVCHVGFVLDGRPCIIPTIYARAGDRLFVHGASVSRIVQGGRDAIDLCVTVTHVDGFVLGRSPFFHSVNYRSVVIFGRGTTVTDAADKREALRLITNQAVRDRWEELREPSEQEMKATGVIEVPITEASAKIRTGGPRDNDEDARQPVWAGVVPVRVALGEPELDVRSPPGVPVFDVSRLRV
jgi:nitroimidazol reductase NimA-like FMN-containing flavoprotein (pyridoxamine 5'-phosphate oxidase superfamily)